MVAHLAKRHYRVCAQSVVLLVFDRLDGRIWASRCHDAYITRACIGTIGIPNIAACESPEISELFFDGRFQLLDFGL